MSLTKNLIVILLSFSCERIHAKSLCEKQLDAFLTGVQQQEPWAVISNVFNFFILNFFVNIIMKNQF